MICCNLDISRVCSAPIFKWKLYFQSKVLSNFWFDQNLVGKVCTCDKLVVKTLQIYDFQNVCWISNTTAARPHYSVFSFHLYSNCGFLALFYIYPAIWCLLPHLTISKHVEHKKKLSWVKLHAFCDTFWLIGGKPYINMLKVFRQKRNFTRWSLKNREKEE